MLPRLYQAGWLLPRLSGAYTEKIQAVRSDVSMQMVSAAAECSMSRELSSADKQRIYEEARAPVRALVTELDEAKLQLDQV